MEQSTVALLSITEKNIEYEDELKQIYWEIYRNSSLMVLSNEILKGAKGALKASYFQSDLLHGCKVN